MKQMKRLTVKEEEIMRIFWEHGPMFVRELLSFYDEPKPHYNTVSTLVRGLEEKGFVGYKAYGNTYQYFGYPIQLFLAEYGVPLLRQCGKPLLLPRQMKLPPSMAHLALSLLLLIIHHYIL